MGVCVGGCVCSNKICMCLSYTTTCNKIFGDCQDNIMKKTSLFISDVCHVPQGYKKIDCIRLALSNIFIVFSV